MASLKQFLSELRRRRVIRAAGLYLLVAWMIIQVGEATFESMALPDWSLRLVIVLLALGFPIVLVLAWAYDLEPTGEKKIVRTDAEAPREDRTPIGSIAVLPFVDMSPDGDQEHFADGIAEELLNTLTSCCTHLRVPARTSSFAFKGKDVDARDIGARLGVDALIEGSVRKSGDRVRITAQLIDVRDGYHLWTQTFDRELVDLFAVQDEIAQCVANSLDVSVTEKERKAVAASAPADVHAYELFLRGKQFFRRGRKQDLEFAQEMYRAAIEIDPDYALSWAWLASACAQSTIFYPTHTSSAANLEEADRASARAMELDPDLADANSARGFALFLLDRFEEAEASFERAIELNPNQFSAHFFFGRVSFQQGKFEHALRLFMSATKIRRNHESAFFAGQSLEALGRHDEAMVQYREALNISVEYMELNPDDPRAATFRAVAHGRLGDSEDGFKWAERALAIDPTDAGVKYNVACFYALAGESGRAIAVLAEALDGGFTQRAWLEKDPDLDTLREDPKFSELLNRT